MAKASKLRYAVQDYAGGKYFTVRIYDTPEEAEDHRSRLGYKAKVKPLKMRA
jgi:hypothetical protein